MGQAVHAMFIHGIGSQKRGYSDYAAKSLATALARANIELYTQEVLWAPILDTLEDRMLYDISRAGSSSKPLQRLALGTLADALCYPSRREDILGTVDAAFMRLRADRCWVFAHSLGGLIATDWLRSRERARVHQLVTFGCNLELFALGTQWACPKQLSGPGRWTNLFDADDMLGYPLSRWQKQVRDVEVSVGPLWSGWTGLSHIEYFDDSKLWGKTVPALITPSR
jgi:pimeloyl-ACP methyl ester carboxylesterase